MPLSSWVQNEKTIISMVLFTAILLIGSFHRNFVSHQQHHSRHLLLHSSSKNSKTHDHRRDEVVLSDECRDLAAEGTMMMNDVDENHLIMHEYNYHVMFFPPPRRNYYLNIPAKSGNHNWRGLFYKLWTGTAPRNFEEVDASSGIFTAEPHHVRMLEPNQQVWALVRNPYTRLLSIYLEKIDCSSYTRHDNGDLPEFAGRYFFYKSEHMFRNYGILTFEQYVIALTNHILFDSNRGSPYLSPEFMQLWVRSLSIDRHELGPSNESSILVRWLEQVPFWGDSDEHYDSHLPDLLPQPFACASRPRDFLMSLIDPTGRVRQNDLPDSRKVSAVERAYRLCTNDHHTCAQASSMLKQQPGRVKVLRLEQQEQWYVRFLKCFGIQKEQVVGNEWHLYEGQQCFYTPTGDCADALMMINDTKLTSGGVHSHKTVDKMRTFYTPLAAELVYYLYEFDFQHLGYKKWDGISAFEPY